MATNEAGMRFGIAAFDLPIGDLVQLGVTADRAGFDSFWLGDHVVLPVGYGSEHPPTTDQVSHQVAQVIRPDSNLVDVWVALGALAAQTTSLHLATGMFVLPMRHPVAAARAAASMSELSDGRFWFGVGTGWLREEFAAVDAPFGNRGDRLDEAIDILRAAWKGGPFQYDGQHYRCEHLQISGSPVHVPLIMGGNSDRALRRAAAHADGYLSSGRSLPLDDTLRLRDRLDFFRREVGRSESLPVWSRIGMSQLDQLDDYRREGLFDIVIRADELCPDPSMPSHLEAVTLLGKELGLRPMQSTESRGMITSSG